MRRLVILLAAAFALAAPAAAAADGFDPARFAAPPSDSRPTTLDAARAGTTALPTRTRTS